MTVSLVAYIKAQKSLDFGRGIHHSNLWYFVYDSFYDHIFKVDEAGDEDEKD